MEKEKYAGMRPSSYLASKLAYLSVLVLVQSVWSSPLWISSGTGAAA